MRARLTVGQWTQGFHCRYVEEKQIMRFAFKGLFIKKKKRSAAFP